jgi:predicted nucleotidyltransferase
VLSDAQAAVVGAIRDWARAERRVRAVLLKGSLGRGEGDPRSDVDLVVVAEAGQFASLWAERFAISERLGRPLGLFRDIALWRPPHLAIALYDGPLKVDLWFEEDEVEPSEWLRSGFAVIHDEAGVADRLRARLAEVSPPPLDPLHSDLWELDSHAWDFALWIERKLSSGDLWLAYLELTKYAELIVIAAWNAVAGKAWAGTTRLAARLPTAIQERLATALPQRVDESELRRSLRELVALYEEARIALESKLRQPLADELAEQVQRIVH